MGERTGLLGANLKVPHILNTKSTSFENGISSHIVISVGIFSLSLFPSQEILLYTIAIRYSLFMIECSLE